MFACHHPSSSLSFVSTLPLLLSHHCHNVLESRSAKPILGFQAWKHILCSGYLITPTYTSHHSHLDIYVISLRVLLSVRNLVRLLSVFISPNLKISQWLLEFKIYCCLYFVLIHCLPLFSVLLMLNTSAPLLISVHYSIQHTATAATVKWYKQQQAVNISLASCPCGVPTHRWAIC